MADQLNLSELIDSLNLKPEQVAIELNQTVIRRGQWQATHLREDDKVEIVHFVGGGFEGSGPGNCRGVTAWAGSGSV